MEKGLVSRVKRIKERKESNSSKPQLFDHLLTTWQQISVWSWDHLHETHTTLPPLPATPSDRESARSERGPECAFLNQLPWWVVCTQFLRTIDPQTF